MKKEITICDFCGEQCNLTIPLELPYMDREKEIAYDKKGCPICSFIHRKRTIKQMDICPECLNHIGDMIYQFDCIQKINRNRPIASIDVKVTNVD